MTWEIKCFLKSVPGVCEWADANSNQNASAFSCAYIWFIFSCAHPRFCHKDGKCLETVQLWVNFSFLKEEFRECSWLQQMSDRRYEKANATSVKSCKGECVALDKVLNKKEIFFLLCSVVWKWLWPSLAVSKRWLLRVYPQGSDLQSFLDFTNPPLINLKSFPLPGGSQTWEVCDGQCLPLGGKCSTSCLKGSFAEIFIKMKTFASKVCASWGASACLWWRRAREWGKDELVAKAMAMAKWRVSIRWECDGKCTNISSLCEEGKIITDQICKRWG